MWTTNIKFPFGVVWTCELFSIKLNQKLSSYLVHSLAVSPAIHPCLNHKLFQVYLATETHHDTDTRQSRTPHSHHMKQQPMHVQLLVAFHSLRILTLRVNLKMVNLTAIEIMFQCGMKLNLAVDSSHEFMTDLLQRLRDEPFKKP